MPPMKAMQLVTFGEPPGFELTELPDPKPGPGEVVVALQAAALNRRDLWIWSQPGYGELPVTLGSDGAGVVAAVGAPSGSGTRPADRAPQVGDEVVIYPTIGWPDGAELPGDSFDILGAPTAGTFAEQVVVPAASVLPRPRRLSLEESAALPLAGLTAWRALFTCGQVDGKSKVLVTGGGSGVATYLVQLAAASGAEVFATTSTPEKADRCRALGAADAFLYGNPRWPEAVRSRAGSLDVVVDSFADGSLSAALPLLRRGGTFVSFGDTGGESVTFDVSEIYWRWRSLVGTTMGSPQEFRALLDHVEHASWRPVVDSVFALERLDDAARRLSASDRFGKVVLGIAL
jgi:zinc-binding alcohol dehydrogenase/oxidoreductase